MHLGRLEARRAYRHAVIADTEKLLRHHHGGVGEVFHSGHGQARGVVFRIACLHGFGLWDVGHEGYALCLVLAVAAGFVDPSGVPVLDIAPGTISIGIGLRRRAHDEHITLAFGLQCWVCVEGAGSGSDRISAPVLIALRYYQGTFEDRIAQGRNRMQVSCFRPGCNQV